MNELIENIWTLVALTGYKFITVNFLGTYKVFMVENFATKTRDNPFNEVRSSVV